MDDPASHERGRELFFLALAAREHGDNAAAEAHLRKALLHAPGRESIRLNLSAALIDQGKFGEALALCRELTRDFPGNAVAWLRLSLCALQSGLLDEARSSVERSLAISPDNLDALRHQLAVLLRLHDTEAALQTARQALTLAPEDASLHTGLGLVHTARREFEATLTCHQQALALQPGDADKRWNLALVQLMLGDFANGWQNMEGRWTGSAPVKSHYSGPMPRWDGTAPQGRRILVWAEQGLGDTLQFCRYLPLLADSGAQVLLQLPPVLVPLLRSLPATIHLFAEGEPLPAHDCHLPLMSVPASLAGQGQALPPPARLSPPAAHLARWRERLGNRSGARLRIGLMWQGNIENQPGLHRSLPLAELAPLLALPLDFHCVSDTLSAADRQWLGEHAPGMQHHTSTLNDFADTAALVAQLDLLISIDTSIAHLGPSLNVPTWVLLSWQADWRWGTQHAHTPWYPASRLFRQQARGDWSAPIAALVQQLQGSQPLG